MDPLHTTANAEASYLPCWQLGPLHELDDGSLVRLIERRPESSWKVIAVRECRAHLAMDTVHMVMEYCDDELPTKSRASLTAGVQFEAQYWTLENDALWISPPPNQDFFVKGMLSRLKTLLGTSPGVRICTRSPGVHGIPAQVFKVDYDSDTTYNALSAAGVLRAYGGYDEIRRRANRTVRLFCNVEFPLVRQIRGQGIVDCVARDIVLVLAPRQVVVGGTIHDLGHS